MGLLRKVFGDRSRRNEPAIEDAEDYRGLGAALRNYMAEQHGVLRPIDEGHPAVVPAPYQPPIAPPVTPAYQHRQSGPIQASAQVAPGNGERAQPAAPARPA
jgi:hypothetical protein